ncbi:hypothetical protein [Actinokineospora iranica]|uniref:Phage tail protein n=1 Tax=Actinokineospora iranica TaxID=1271860 RepID=A0A1G6K505_9PSEU|nr:hypothetical protein [Actinokineospora iranica]SDC25921.1 hypothetical protein SAMN05216174_101713 [Actinokineospora iranica]
MQYADDRALAAAVTFPDRTPVARLAADWARDGQYSHPLSDLSSVLEAVTVERSITGDLPAECTLIEGHTAATLTATLAGARPDDPLDMARMLSPYRPDSPLRGVSVVDVPLYLELGLVTTAGRRLVRQFTGTTRALHPSAADRTVTIDALDPAERLRAAVTLPVWAASERTYRNPAIWPYRDRTNTQWIIDHVLRRNGIHLSPPPRPGVLWAMTCHGGLAPDIGFDASLIIGRKTSASVPEFVPGAYGLAANGGQDCFAWGSGRTMGKPFALGSGRAHLIEFHIHAGAANTLHPNADGTVLSVSTSLVKLDGTTIDAAITSDGQLQARIWDNPTTTPVLRATITGPRITGQAAWHSVGLWISYDHATRTVTTRWHLDGTQTGPVTLALELLHQVTAARGNVQFRTPLPVQCLQLAETTTIPAGWGAPHVPQADLDVGLNWVTGLPEIVGGDSWSLIKQTVAAEYGLAAFDEHGRFTFRTRTRPRPAPVKSITAAVDLGDLTPSIALDSVRNEITHACALRLERDTATVYTARTPDELDTPFGTTTRTLVLDHRCRINTTVLRHSRSTWDGDVLGGYVCVNPATGAEVGNVTVTLTANDDQATARLVVSNPNQFTVRFATDDQPAFRIAGNPVTDDPTHTTITRDQASAARYGRRALELPATPFHQHPDPTTTVAASLLADLADPVAVLAEIPVLGDPRVQLGDVVTVADPDGLGGPITAAVIGTRRTHSITDGLTDSLTLRVLPT